MRVYFNYAVWTKIGTTAFVESMYKILLLRDISLFYISQNNLKLIYLMINMNQLNSKGSGQMGLWQHWSFCVFIEGQQLQSLWRTAMVLSSVRWIYCSTMWVHSSWVDIYLYFFVALKSWQNDVTKPYSMPCIKKWKNCTQNLHKLQLSFKFVRKCLAVVQVCENDDVFMRMHHHSCISNIMPPTSDDSYVWEFRESE